MSLMEAELPAQLEELVGQLVDDDTRAIAKPKGLIAETTQDGYGYYMGVLGKLPAIPGLSPTGSMMLWGLVLVRSGANEAGVKAALRVMT